MSSSPTRTEKVSSLVLLHGWGLGPSVWKGLVERLPPGLSVLTPALPGHGDAPPAPGPTLEAWADALLPAIPAGATVCGWSLGGLLALDLARRHPDSIARLILIGTSPCFVAHAAETGREAWPHGIDAGTVEAFLRGFANDPSGTLRRFVALQVLGDARRRTVGNELGAALAPCHGERALPLADGLEILASADLRPALEEVRQPTLLLHGAHDALMPVSGARWLAEALPSARLVTFDDCGHAPFLSRPAECAELIGTAALG